MNHQAFHFRNDWENLDTTAINRELSHAPWGAYEDAAQAGTLDSTRSHWYLSLDGTWKFAYKDKPELVESFYEDGFSHESWSDIRVPGNWELQGFGEPIYTNTLFPWNHFGQAPHILRPHGNEDTSEVRGLPNPPHLPPENPTGCYFRTFEVPEDWKSREVFIHFKGVETAYYLWINGQPVGYSEDSKLPSEFNITALLQPGRNTVALQVMRFATSTYLEDQDYWYLSGIFRSVCLQAKPRIRITDWKIDALSDRHHPDGTIQADIMLNQENGFADYRVRLDILTMDDKILASGEGTPQPRAQYRMTEQATAGTARIRLSLRDIVAWTPETPVLYKAVMTLIAPDGTEMDFESGRIGFKRVEIENGILLLNGKRLLVRGVNRHEHEAHGGRTVTREHMVKEIQLMKQLGINAVRTCHYPDDPTWYDLCDEWGLLTICECNLETHGVQGALTHNPAWGVNFLERAIRMVLTHKNHASVYAWSLGNESGTGANHAAMYGWIKEYDPTRICQYEAGQPGKNVSDVRGNMYAPPAHILNMLTDPDDIRPIILVEYLYQIRNAGGGMHHFNDFLERHPRFQGGYIWDWQDKCLVAKTEDGTPYFGYGGDFGESVTDWECPPFMTNNGIVLPDLTPKPVAWEVKQAYCPIQLEEIRQTNPWILDGEPGRILVRNRTLCTGLSAFRAAYALRENGRIIETGEFALPDIAAGEQAEACFVQKSPRHAGAEYHVDITIHTAQASAYAVAGFELGCFQFRLKSGDAACPCDMNPRGATRAEALALTETDTALTVTGNGYVAVFSKETGRLASLAKNGIAYLADGPTPCFTRPPSGIDAIPGWGREKIWRTYTESALSLSPIAFHATALGADRVLVESTLRIQSKAIPQPILVILAQTFCSDGTLKVEATYHMDESLGDLPRVGMELMLPAGFETFTYYGYGPGENYRDRLLAARLGVFDSTVAQEHFPFIPPSENGGHEQTRWIHLRNAEGATLRVRADIPFHFDIHHNTIAEYRAAGHDHELVRHPESWLHIDTAHAGIGSDLGWSTFLTEADQVKASTRMQRFILEIQ